MRKNLVRYLDDPDSISEEVVYTKFKNVHLTLPSASANT
jgi:hypothetical protein